MDILETIDTLTGVPESERVAGVTYVAPRQVEASELRFSDAHEYQAMIANGTMPEAQMQQIAQVETMVSNRVLPWHRLANVVYEDLGLGNVTDVAKALELAGLNWTVGREAVSVLGTEQDKYRAITRTDTGDVFAIMRDTYTPVQNIEAFEAVEEILGQSNAVLETAGTLRGGARVWLQARIPSDLTIGGDTHYPYLTFSNSHDGTAACRLDVTAVRAECRNSIRIGKAEAASSLSLRHTRNVNARLTSAAAILGLVDQFSAAYEAEVAALMARTISNAEFDKLVEEMFPVMEDATAGVQARQKDRQALVHAFYERDEDGGRFRGTGWGALNAVNSYELWAAPARDDDYGRQVRTLTRLTGGQPQPLTQRAYKRLAVR